MSKVRTSAEGRKCAVISCGRILSIYNHQAYCHCHLNQMLEEETTRSKTIRKTEKLSIGD